MLLLLASILAISSAGIGFAAHTNAVRVMDDLSRNVVLAQPAARIVSLAPHITELLFAAGAGEYVVGTVAYSDYPIEAQRIVRIGDNAQLDLERIVALHPDLIVVWLHGNAQRQLEKLVDLGIPGIHNEPRRLDDVAVSIERLGRLAGTELIANNAADTFRARLAELRGNYAGRPPVRLFYQVWDKPLITINGSHLISDVIRLCGGENVFADLAPFGSRPFWLRMW